MEYINQLFATLHKIELDFVSRIPNMIIGLLLFIITFFVAKLITRLVGNSLSRTSLRTNLILIFQKFTSIGVWIIGGLIIFAILFPSVTPAHLITALGLGTVAIGFAFKDIFENFLAGIIILYREPYHIKDYIQCKDEEGYIEYISIRNTHLRRGDGVRIVLPNSMLYNNPVRVLTDMEFRREQITFAINNSENIEKTREIIKNTLHGCKTVAKDHMVQIYVKSFTSGNIEFELTWWTHPKPSDLRQSKDEVLSNLKKALDQAKISLSINFGLAFQEPLVIQTVE